MAEPQWNVCIPLREADEKTKKETVYWQEIGKGWVTKKGYIQVILNAHPIGREVMLFPNVLRAEEKTGD